MWTGIYLYRPDTDSVCSVEHGNRLALLRLAMRGRHPGVRGDHLVPVGKRQGHVWVQAAIIALVALIQWFAFATSDTPEASGLPYRHLFLVWAPCIVAVVALAPSIAPWIFRVPNDVCQDFRQLLPGAELFVHRPPAPDLTIRRIIYATVYGPAYHPLHLLLFPAFVALVAPAGWLYLFSFLASVRPCCWCGERVRALAATEHLSRARLSERDAVIISLFVIIVAVLRLVQFDYVSTLLDAMPFGTIFGLVVMNYVLFWLVEYWMNRVASLQLLGLMGEPTDEVRVDYPRNAADDTGIRVMGRSAVVPSSVPALAPNPVTGNRVLGNVALSAFESRRRPFRRRTLPGLLPAEVISLLFTPARMPRGP